ncbi:MAG TPA: ABC transporter permease [Streptosporangiaceae bacterium]|nr:ABC transporter permease [Streptosporangiaceae bacterium]
MTEPVSAAASPAGPAPDSSSSGRPGQEAGGTREQIEAAIAERRRRRARRDRRTYLAIRIVSLAVVLAAWQWYGMHSIAIIFDPITKVLAALAHLWREGGLGSAIWYSLWTFAIGYLAGLIAGVVIGMCIGAYQKAEAAAGLYLQALYATPMVAIVPLLSIWLGFGVLTQELIIALFVLFPSVVTVSYGVRNLDTDLLEVARSLRMSRLSLWRHVLLPGTVPYIAAGAAQGVAMGLVGMFIAEIFTQLTGLGNLLETAAQTYHTDEALAVLLVIMTLGVLLRALITFIQRKVAPWAK